MLVCDNCAVPAAHPLFGGFVYTLGSSLLALQVQDAAPLAGSGGILDIILETGPLNQVVLAILFLFDRFLGDHSFQDHFIRTSRAAERYISRRLSPQSEVFRGPGDLSVAAAEPAGRSVPGGLCRDQRTIPDDQSVFLQSRWLAGTSNA